MSTTYAVKDVNGELHSVAFRSRNIRFTDPIAHLLIDDTKVYPIDDSNQGIFSIKDIKDAIASDTPSGKNEQ